MKHSDQKKLASMLCVSVLSVSSFFGCAYGPDPEHSLVQDYSLDFSTIAEAGENLPEAEISQQ